MTTGRRDDEREVQVCRSRIDPDVWWVFSDEQDSHDWENPGRVQAVKRYAEREYARGKRVRWERVDENTWRMRTPRAEAPVPAQQEER